MCQAVSYVHPSCGHLIAAPSVWIPERCKRAIATGYECWIPGTLPLRKVQRRTWVGKPLGRCLVCAPSPPEEETQTPGDAA